MTKKTTKRALLLSVLSMMLCVAMLVGSTFAWFTDSVTSGMNRIVAGNLDVELYHTNARIKDTATDDEKKVGENTKLFVSADDKEFQWEPGAMLYENLTVKNAGSLALKYKLMLNAECNSVDGRSLGNVLKVAVLNEAFNGDREEALKLDFNMTVAEFVASGAVAASGELDAGETDTRAVIIYWKPTENDNDYNFNNGRADSLYIKLGVNLVATQAVSESDGFNDQYDKDAEYPIVLPKDVTIETFEEKNAVAYAGDTYYSTFTEAVEATEGVIYLMPNAKLTEKVTHAHVIGNLTIYGNGASLTNGTGEHDLEIDTFEKKGYLEDDVTINIYNLNGIAVWGQRNTEYTANINLYGCHDIERVYISGAKGVNNISLTNCSASSFGTRCKLYSNAAGEIKVTNCSFDTVCEPVNFNNKSAGVQNIYITDCTFTNCSTADITTTDAEWAAPIRAIAAGEGAVTNLYLKGNKFVYTDGKSPVNGVNVLTEELRENKQAEIKGTVNVIDNVVASVNQNGETKINGAQISVSVPNEAVAGDTLMLTMEPTDKPDNFTVEIGNKTTITFEINVEGLKADNTEDITVELFVGKNLEDVELYHYSEKVDATYDAATGCITFTTTSFSPFTVVYKTIIAVSNETELRNALNETDPVFIKLTDNITISETVNITKDVNLDLNGKTITNDVSAGRVFFVTKPNVTLTIDGTKEGSGIHTSEAADGKTYGIVDMRAGSDGSKLVINGGTYTGNTNNGALFKVRDNNVAVELNNVTARTNRWVFDTENNPVSGTTLTVNGGHFTSTEIVNGSMYSVFKFKSNPIGGNETNIRFTDTTIVSAGGACIDLTVGVGEFNNCNFTVTNPSNPAHTASAIGVSNGSTAVINGGSYTSDGYGAYVYTSGGTIEINGGAVITGKAKALACSAASYYYYSGQIILNDGTINGDIYAYNDGDRPADIIINGGSVNGSFSTEGTATIHIYGGRFKADPTAYIDETTTYATENGDGTWSVATIDEGDIEDPFGD